ncbi:MAG TPA: hypothetical protein PLI09_10235, partial [Candidatus Hydrogenedentes bacterium]|nr:hypothetical protein [Candidatus Hydrogenedentota bacterium]
IPSSITKSEEQERWDAVITAQAEFLNSLTPEKQELYKESQRDLSDVEEFEKSLTDEQKVLRQAYCDELIRLNRGESQTDAA